MSTQPILRTGQRVRSFTTNNLPILPPTTNHTVRVYQWYTHHSTYTRPNPISRYPLGRTGTCLGNQIQNIKRQRPGHGHTTFRIPRHLVIHLSNSGSIPIHHKNLKITILIHQHLPLPQHHTSCTGIPDGNIILPGSIPLGAQTSIISNIPNNASPRGQHPQSDQLHNTNGHNRPPLTIHCEHMASTLYRVICSLLLY
jgi:hypothetical protein